MKITARVITSFLSAAILAIILSYMNYTPLVEQQRGIGYDTFSSMFQVFFIYSLPVFLIGGILYSLLVDVVSRKVSLGSFVSNYLFNVVSYASGGFVIMGILVFPADSIVRIVWEPLLLGVICSLLFFHINLGIEKTLEKLLKNYTIIN